MIKYFLLNDKLINSLVIYTIELYLFIKNMVMPPMEKILQIANTEAFDLWKVIHFLL